MQTAPSVTFFHGFAHLLHHATSFESNMRLTSKHVSRFAKAPVIGAVRSLLVLFAGIFLPQSRLRSSVQPTSCSGISHDNKTMRWMPCRRSFSTASDRHNHVSPMYEHYMSNPIHLGIINFMGLNSNLSLSVDSNSLGIAKCDMRGGTELRAGVDGLAEHHNAWKFVYSCSAYYLHVVRFW